MRAIIAGVGARAAPALTVCSELVAKGLGITPGMVASAAKESGVTPGMVASAAKDARKAGVL